MARGSAFLAHRVRWEGVKQALTPEGVSLPPAGASHSTNKHVSLPASPTCPPRALLPVGSRKPWSRGALPVSEHLRLVRMPRGWRSFVRVHCGLHLGLCLVRCTFILLNSCEVSLTSALSSQLSIWILGHVSDGPGRDSPV